MHHVDFAPLVLAASRFEGKKQLDRHTSNMNLSHDDRGWRYECGRIYNRFKTTMSDDYYLTLSFNRRSICTFCGIKSAPTSSVALEMLILFSMNYGPHILHS